MSNWISTENDKPPKHERVLFWLHEIESFATGSYSYDQELWIDEVTDGQNEPMKWYEHEVSHWMFPEPPTQEDR